MKASVKWFSKFLKNHYEEIISFSALAISLCALFVSINEAKMNREHDKLSVRPALIIYSHQEIENDTISFETDVINNGIGPAVIEKFEVFFDKKPIAANNINYPKKILFEEAKNIIEGVITQVGILREGTVLSANDKRRLIVITYPASKNSQVSKPLSLLVMRFDFKITYKSLYEESFTLTSDKSIIQTSRN